MQKKIFILLEIFYILLEVFVLFQVDRNIMKQWRDYDGRILWKKRKKFQCELKDSYL